MARFFFSPVFCFSNERPQQIHHALHALVRNLSPLLIAPAASAVIIPSTFSAKTFFLSAFWIGIPARFACRPAFPPSSLSRDGRGLSESSSSETSSWYSPPSFPSSSFLNGLLSRSSAPLAGRGLSESPSFLKLLLAVRSRSPLSSFLNDSLFALLPSPFRTRSIRIPSFLKLLLGARSRSPPSFYLWDDLLSDLLCRVPLGGRSLLHGFFSSPSRGARFSRSSCERTGFSSSLRDERSYRPVAVCWFIK